MTSEIQFGNYTLVEELGSGGFGTVYKATDNIGRTVAVKVLKPGWDHDPSTIERFRREAQAAGELFHKNIATIIEFGQMEGRLFLVMRHVDGKPLDQLIEAQGRLSWDQALGITKDIAEALDYAHERGFVHRDIKPANILVSESEGAVLTDFGLVKAAQVSGLSTTGVTLGTPNYIAPEVWDGQETSPATDVYSLACVFYEMITGEKLFAGDSAPQIMTQHMLKGPQFPEQWPQGTPAWVPAVLEKALAKESHNRYPGTDPFIEALTTGHDHQIEETSREPGKSAKQQTTQTHSGTQKPKKNRRILGWVAGCGVISLILLVLAGVFLARWLKSNTAPIQIAAEVVETTTLPEASETLVATKTPIPSSTATNMDTISSTTESSSATQSPIPTNVSSPTQEFVGDPHEIPGIPIAVGQTIKEVVDEETNPRDVYAIDLIAGQEYIIDFGCLNNCGYSVDLVIANPDSTSIEFDQWSKSIEMHAASSTPTRSYFAPAVSGFYYFVVNADNTNHQYSLLINQGSSDLDPGNMGEIPGMPLSINQDLIGVVDEETNPLDVFAIDLTAGEEYVIEFGCLNSCGYSVDLVIANPDSKSIEFDQWSKSIEMHAASSTPTLSYFAPAVTGTYYIIVSADNPNHKYSLKLSRNITEVDPGQVGDIPGMPITLGKDIIGVVDEETNPLDVFSIDLTADNEYVIDFGCLNNCGYSIDLFVANPDSTSFVYEQWSKSIEMHAASSDPTREFFTPAVSGTYYIAISADNPNHKYSLSVNQVP